MTPRSRTGPPAPRRASLRHTLPLLGMLAVAQASAAPQHYELDPVHTRIVFAIDHLGFSKSLGTFSHPSGSLWFDPDDWRSARLDVTVDIASLDLGDEAWRKRMFKRDYFDLDDHAQARFVSTAVEPTGDTTARVHGHLTLRGTTLPLSLDVTLNRHGRHPLTLRTTAGFSATATLKRSDFGMDDNLRTVGDTVELRIEAEAARKRASRGESEDNPGPSSRPTTTEPA